MYLVRWEQNWCTLSSNPKHLWLLTLFSYVIPENVTRARAVDDFIISFRMLLLVLQWAKN